MKNLLKLLVLLIVAIIGLCIFISFADITPKQQEITKTIKLHQTENIK